jgi:hypothetical protein
MRRIALFGVLLTAVLAAALVRGAGPDEGVASSHREAPVISEDPTADNTDVYAFVSPDRPNTVTIVANYIPLEEPAGGPNFNQFADDSEREHVPLQHRPDRQPLGHGLEPTPEIQGHPCQEERFDRPRAQPPDPPCQYRTALDGELRRVDAVRCSAAVRGDQGLRGSER